MWNARRALTLRTLVCAVCVMLALTADHAEACEPALSVAGSSLILRNGVVEHQSNESRSGSTSVSISDYGGDNGKPCYFIASLNASVELAPSNRLTMRCSSSTYLSGCVGSTSVQTSSRGAARFSVGPAGWSMAGSLVSRREYGGAGVVTVQLRDIRGTVWYEYVRATGIGYVTTPLTVSLPAGTYILTATCESSGTAQASSFNATFAECTITASLPPPLEASFTGPSGSLVSDAATWTPAVVPIDSTTLILDQSSERTLHVDQDCSVRGLAVRAGSTTLDLPDFILRRLSLDTLHVDGGVLRLTSSITTSPFPIGRLRARRAEKSAPSPAYGGMIVIEPYTAVETSGVQFDIGPGVIIATAPPLPGQSVPQAAWPQFIAPGVLITAGDRAVPPATSPPATLMIDGVGSVSQSLTNDGDLILTTDADVPEPTFIITRDFTQNATGVMEVWLDGAESNVGRAIRTVVGRNARLGGTLRIRRNPAYIARPGDHFTISQPRASSTQASPRPARRATAHLRTQRSRESRECSIPAIRTCSGVSTWSRPPSAPAHMRSAWSRSSHLVSSVGLAARRGPPRAWCSADSTHQGSPISC